MTRKSCKTEEVICVECGEAFDRRLKKRNNCRCRSEKENKKEIRRVGSITCSPKCSHIYHSNKGRRLREAEKEMKDG